VAEQSACSRPRFHRKNLGADAPGHAGAGAGRQHLGPRRAGDGRSLPEPLGHRPQVGTPQDLGDALEFRGARPRPDPVFERPDPEARDSDEGAETAL
jgi:hypothetical protein